jgi:hypothetical protein
MQLRLRSTRPLVGAADPRGTTEGRETMKAPAKKAAKKAAKAPAKKKK